MFKTKKKYAKKLLRILNALNTNLVPDFMGINNDRFINGKSRKLNRLRESAQVIDKKFY